MKADVDLVESLITYIHIYRCICIWVVATLGCTLLCQSVRRWSTLKVSISFCYTSVGVVHMNVVCLL